jgi:hypothetical protein
MKSVRDLCCSWSSAYPPPCIFKQVPHNVKTGRLYRSEIYNVKLLGRKIRLLSRNVFFVDPVNRCRIMVIFFNLTRLTAKSVLWEKPEFFIILYANGRNYDRNVYCFPVFKAILKADKFQIILETIRKIKKNKSYKQIIVRDESLKLKDFISCSVSSFQISGGLPIRFDK